MMQSKVRLENKPWGCGGALWGNSSRGIVKGFKWQPHSNNNIPGGSLSERGYFCLLTDWLRSGGVAERMITIMDCIYTALLCATVISMNYSFTTSV